MTDPAALRLAELRNNVENVWPEQRRQQQVKHESRTRRPHAKAYSTKYAREWGKSQGWVVLASETYNFRTGRTNDLPLAIDLLFQTPTGLVGIQAAGRYERSAHFERFEACAGAKKAAERRIKVIYQEYVRSSKIPVLQEVWAE